MTNSWDWLKRLNEIDACLGQKSEVSTFSERMAAAEARLDQLESDRDSQAAQISALETQNGLIEARLDEAEATIANILEILDGPL